MDVEDEIPEGFAEARPGERARAGKAPGWLVPVQLAGYLVAVGLFFAMAGSTRAGVATRAAYQTAPVCTVGAARPCGPNDDTRETITVTGSTVIADARNQPTGLVLEFTDPSGQLSAGASASFTGEEMPSLDSASGVGEQFAAELWQGQLMWVAAVGDPDGDRYYSDQSVEHTTRYLLVAPALVGGIAFVCCCFGWWSLVRRGRVSDRGSFRPLYALVCVIVIGSGWELLARTRGSGVTVLGAGLAMSALLGLPLPTRAWAWAAGRYDARVRSRRARRAEARGREGMFR